MPWNALLKETLMIRKSQILSAVALAILLPIAAHAAEASTAAKSKTHMAAATKKTAKMPAVDINSASKEDLMKLPGITDETAEKIIAGRPYKSKTELSKKNILSKVEYGKVRNHVVARQEGKAEAKSLGSTPEAKPADSK
jgi:DNA uptake protein ComE-like DNA-binding protein